ncbi:unnamed protein product [Citrullus colocynthis]|uniref:Secreted protein n=1 Tax=Citrullus colocynthis TaxID=252529 RepID=A0ABP0Z3P8_9ROSI
MEPTSPRPFVALSVAISVCSSCPPARSLFVTFSDKFSVAFSGILILPASSSFSAAPDLRSARFIDNLHCERQFTLEFSTRSVSTIRVAPTAKIHSRTPRSVNTHIRERQDAQIRRSSFILTRSVKSELIAT